MVSRNVPPRWAVTTIMPALGGASRMSCHSSAEKSDFVVIVSPIGLHSPTLVALTVATGCSDFACAVSMINASTRTAAADAPVAQNDTANPCLDRREAEQIRRSRAVDLARP